VIDIEHSKIYLSPEDYEIVKEEEPYVQKRYFIIALMLQEKPFGLSRAEGVHSRNNGPFRSGKYGRFGKGEKH
jgi:hypothetical protein